MFQRRSELELTRSISEEAIQLAEELNLYVILIFHLYKSIFPVYINFLSTLL